MAYSLTAAITRAKDNISKNHSHARTELEGIVSFKLYSSYNLSVFN